MTVTLNIAQDQELRSYIKDLIKGQVLAVTREEITDIVRQEINRRIENTPQYQWERWIKESIDKVIENTLYNKLGVSKWSSNSPEVVKVINGLLEQKIANVMPNIDWEASVNKLATEKIKSLIK